MRDPSARPFARILALALTALVTTWGGCIPFEALKPSPGFTQLAEMTSVNVPGGMVNTRGGNLIVSRSDISLDTPLGTQDISATYNSTSGEWLWNFQMTYDGDRFIDPSGAVFEHITRSGVLASDGTILGTFWVRVDQDTIKTKGGRAYHFRSDGTLSHMSWATMAYPRIAFSATEISQCTQATTCAPIFEITLDPGGNPLAITDARTGRVAEFAYDYQGRLVAAKSPLDVANGTQGFRYEYSALGSLLTSVTNAEGERTEYEYQGDRRILHVKRIGEGDPRHRFEFYGKYLDRWTTVHTNPLGGETRYQFDRFKRLREVVRPSVGEVQRFRYGSGELPAFTRPRLVIEPSGARTTYRYSREGDVIEIGEPSGNVITYSYTSDAIDPNSPFSRPTARIEDSVGLIASVAYDGLGRPVRLDLAEGNSVTSGYGPATLSSLTLPFGDPISFDVYGAHGHWTDASFPQAGFPIRRAIDVVGNVLVPAAGLQNGGVLDTLFDPNRRIAQIHVAATEVGHVTSDDYVSIDRRSDGRVRTISRPHGADHSYVYDSIGRAVVLRERVDGVWQDTSFEYDLAGNLTSRERPNGMREEFSFDEYGRLVGRRALRDGVLEGELTIIYERGLPMAFSDSKRGAGESYVYDAAERLTQILYSSGESLEFSHDLRSRMVMQKFVLAGGEARAIGVEYDRANRPTAHILDGSETLAQYFYEDFRHVRTEYGNGLTRFSHYDPKSGQVDGYTTEDAGGLVVEDTVVTRGPASAPQRYRVSSATTTTLASTTENYDFGLAGVISDIDKRVGNRVWGWDDGSGNAKQYVYNELSNLQSNGSGDAFVYNLEENRLTSATLAHEGVSHSYVYDAAGFVVERDGVPIGWSATGKIASYGPVSVEWDMVNRPVSIAAGTLAYDFELFGGLVASDPATGAVGTIDLGFVSVPFSGQGRLYRHRDFRRNTSFTSDESGTIVSHYRYTAYGVDSIFGAATDTRRFVGAHEIGDGLFLLGWRVYDAHAARFLSPDPILQHLNQYAYTLGNPVDFLDANGLEQVSQSEAGPGGASVASNLMAAALATAVFVYAVVSGLAVGAIILAGAAVVLQDWNAAVAIDQYKDAKRKADTGAETGGTRIERPQDTLDGVRTTWTGRAGGAAGSLGGGVFGAPASTMGRLGLAGLRGVAGCGDGAPGQLVWLDLRSRWYPVAILLCLHLFAAAFVLRSRGVKREG